MDKNLYIDKFYDTAKKAGILYNINPIVILSQGALEGNWGSSNLAINANNHFGVTAGGAKNEYWDGSYVTTSKGLKMRKYKTFQNSFFDFARLIRQAYKKAADNSNNIPVYAGIIAMSAYISEKNGDNREDYRKGILKNAALIDDILKKKAL